MRIRIYALRFAELAAMLTGQIASGILLIHCLTAMGAMIGFHIAEHVLLSGSDISNFKKIPKKVDGERAYHSTRQLRVLSAHCLAWNLRLMMMIIFSRSAMKGVRCSEGYIGGIRV